MSMDTSSSTMDKGVMFHHSIIENKAALKSILPSSCILKAKLFIFVIDEEINDCIFHVPSAMLFDLTTHFSIEYVFSYLCANQTPLDLQFLLPSNKVY